VLAEAAAAEATAEALVGPASLRVLSMNSILARGSRNSAGSLPPSAAATLGSERPASEAMDDCSQHVWSSERRLGGGGETEEEEQRAERRERSASVRAEQSVEQSVE